METIPTNLHEERIAAWKERLRQMEERIGDRENKAGYSATLLSSVREALESVLPENAREAA